jgi:hypothetical protein
MPYIIVIHQPDGDVFYGPDRTFVSFIEGAQPYQKIPGDLEILQAGGFDADLEMVP